VADLTRRRPGVTLDIRPVPRTRQALAVRDREIDVGFGRAVTPDDYDEGIACERLFDDPLRFALVSATGAFGRKESLTAADLRELPVFMITREEGRGLHDRLLAAFRAIGLAPKVEPTPSIYGAVVPLVAAGVGWVPSSDAMTAQPLPGVVALPLEGFALASGFDVLWWRASPSPVVQELVAAVREAARTSRR
jgi:DNA-binding transcriptional LysR family regulator